MSSLLKILPLLLYGVSFVTSLPIISKPLENNPDLVWEALLTIDTRNIDPDKARKVPKSIFITPNLNESKIPCPTGHKLGPDGKCYKTLNIDPLDILKTQIASLFPRNRTTIEYDEYDYNDYSESPELINDDTTGTISQYDVPLSLGFADEQLPQQHHSSPSSSSSSAFHFPTRVIKDDSRIVFDLNYHDERYERQPSIVSTAIDAATTAALKADNIYTLVESSSISAGTPSTTPPPPPSPSPSTAATVAAATAAATASKFETLTSSMHPTSIATTTEMNADDDDGGEVGDVVRTTLRPFIAPFTPATIITTISNQYLTSTPPPSSPQSPQHRFASTPTTETVKSTTATYSKMERKSEMTVSHEKIVVVTSTPHRSQHKPLDTVSSSNSDNSKITHHLPYVINATSDDTMPRMEMQQSNERALTTTATAITDDDVVIDSRNFTERLAEELLFDGLSLVQNSDYTALNRTSDVLQQHNVSNSNTSNNSNNNNNNNNDSDKINVKSDKIDNSFSPTSIVSQGDSLGGDIIIDDDDSVDGDSDSDSDGRFSTVATEVPIDIDDSTTYTNDEPLKLENDDDADVDIAVITSTMPTTSNTDRDEYSTSTPPTTMFDENATASTNGDADDDAVPSFYTTLVNSLRNSTDDDDNIGTIIVQNSNDDRIEIVTGTTNSDTFTTSINHNSTATQSRIETTPAPNAQQQQQQQQQQHQTPQPQPQQRQETIVDGDSSVVGPNAQLGKNCYFKNYLDHYYIVCT